MSFGSLVAHPDGSVNTGGVEGVDANLVIKPFSQKGVVESLRVSSPTTLSRTTTACSQWSDSAEHRTRTAME